MDCSAFRRHHVAYVDDTLPGDLVVAAARHAAECPRCGQYDTAVRRSLLLVRNLPSVQCSADFAARLEARLDSVRAERHSAQGAAVGRDDWSPSLWELTSARLRGRPAAAAAAALLAVAAGRAVFHPEAPQAWAPAGAAVAQMAPFASPFSPPAAPLWVAVEEPVFEPGAGDPVAWVTYDGRGGAGVDAASLVLPAATGASMWPAAMLAGEAPATLWRDAASGDGSPAGGGVMLVAGERAAR
jgi:hypothetical protein